MKYAGTMTDEVIRLYSINVGVCDNVRKFALVCWKIARIPKTYLHMSKFHETLTQSCPKDSNAHLLDDGAG